MPPGRLRPFGGNPCENAPLRGERPGAPAVVIAFTPDRRWAGTALRGLGAGGWRRIHLRLRVGA